MALNGTLIPIQTINVGAGGQAAFEFTNIPQIYDDLVIIASLRSTRGNGNVSDIRAEFNGSSTGYTARRVYGSGTGTGTDTSLASLGNAASQTANTFSSHYFYISNYRSSNNKSYMLDSVAENNASGAYVTIANYLWANSAAITSVLIRDFSDGNANSLVQHSTATLYGVSMTTSKIKATGGALYDDANYVYHLFTSSGTFTPAQTLTAEVLVVAGGGSGGGGVITSGGGGAGGINFSSSTSFTSGVSYTATVGAGATGASIMGSTGSNSSLIGGAVSITGNGGGGGAGSSNPGPANGLNGGCGGGASSNNTTTGAIGTGGTGSQGGNGGRAWANSSSAALQGSGGGGGMGGNGGSASSGVSGNGGPGVSTYSSWGLATQTGQNISGTYWYAGGGGADSRGGTAGLGGNGGGGAGGNTASVVTGVAGMASTGGGGGAGYGSNGGNGGSGVVIIRYAK
jgi:hypothetical protein